MGHDSMRAALICQHATQKADRRIADAPERMLDEHGEPAQHADDGPDDGSAGVLVPAS